MKYIESEAKEKNQTTEGKKSPTMWAGKKEKWWENQRWDISKRKCTNYQIYLKIFLKFEKVTLIIYLPFPYLQFSDTVL